MNDTNYFIFVLQKHFAIMMGRARLYLYYILCFRLFFPTSILKPMEILFVFLNLTTCMLFF